MTIINHGSEFISKGWIENGARAEIFCQKQKAATWKDKSKLNHGKFRFFTKINSLLEHSDDMNLFAFGVRA